jgi:hypothetical protein
VTHEELCERARRWLAGTRRCQPVFSHLASCGEIPDAIGWSSCYQWHGSTVVECKTSRSDFYADRRKYLAYHEHQFGWRYAAVRITAKQAKERGYTAINLPRMGDFRFYMCEPDVLPADLIAKHAPDHGLIYVDGARRLKLVIPAPRRESAMINKDAEIRYLRFAIINAKSPHEQADLELEAITDDR